MSKKRRCGCCREYGHFNRKNAYKIDYYQKIKTESIGFILLQMRNGLRNPKHGKLRCKEALLIISVV